MDRLSKQEINKETLSFNHTLDQIDITNIHRKFLPTVAKYIFFSNAHRAFLRIGHRISQKTIIKFKMTEIIISTFFDHRGIKQN